MEKEMNKKTPSFAERHGVELKTTYPPLEEILDGTISNLDKILEEREIVALYEKYIECIKSGRKIHPLLMEDDTIYDNAKQLYEQGKLGEFEELCKKRNSDYMDSLNEQFIKLRHKIDTKILEKFEEDIKTGKVNEVKEELTKMKENIIIKNIRSEKECVTESQKREYDIAKMTAPVRAKLFGVNIETIEMQQEPRKTIDVKKVNIETPKVKSGADLKEEKEEKSHD